MASHGKSREEAHRSMGCLRELLRRLSSRSKSIRRQRNVQWSPLCRTEAVLYFYFLGYVLLIVNNMNAVFQSEQVSSPWWPGRMFLNLQCCKIFFVFQVRLHLYLDMVASGLKQILDNFVKKQVLQGKVPFEVDESDPDALLYIEKIHFGAKFEMFILRQGSRISKDALRVRSNSPAN